MTKTRKRYRIQLLLVLIFGSCLSAKCAVTAINKNYAPSWNLTYDSVPSTVYGNFSLGTHWQSSQGKTKSGSAMYKIISGPIKKTGPSSFVTTGSGGTAKIRVYNNDAIGMSTVLTIKIGKTEQESHKAPGYTGDLSIGPQRCGGIVVCYTPIPTGSSGDVSDHIMRYGEGEYKSDALPSHS